MGVCLLHVMLTIWVRFSTYTIQGGENLGALYCRFESGDFFALDMGGTNFRTVYVKLSDKHGEMVMLLRTVLTATAYCRNCDRLLLSTVLPGTYVQATSTNVSSGSSAHVCLCP